MISRRDLLPDRACGPCTGCCALFTIAELHKPAGVLCHHSGPGGACAIYEARPDSCRVFFCGYRTWSEVPADWRPDRTHFVLGGRIAAGETLSVTVDPRNPDAWRRDPYYPTLKQWAGRAAQRGSQIAVFIGSRALILEPDREVDLGGIASDEVIAVVWRETADGRLRDYVKRSR